MSFGADPRSALMRYEDYAMVTHPQDPPMIPSIKHIAPSAEIYILEGCHIIEQSNSPDDPQLSVARARVAPGVTTRWHRLKDTTERYYILQGTGTVYIGETPPTPVGVGDVVIIPPFYPQCITNTGSGDLIFLAICTPRFRDEVYEALDNCV